MFERGKINRPDDFFTDINTRNKKVYFYRTAGINKEIYKFMKRYYICALSSGAVIEDKIQNPTEKNLEYYEETMGMDFRLDYNFINFSLRKWMPRISQQQIDNISLSMFYKLDYLKKSGKNENMIKNAYIKFMCWLYYKFERLSANLGAADIPKILYGGTPGKYELMFLEVLSSSGCDILILEYNDGSGYSRSDPVSEISDQLIVNNMEEFPSDFSLETIRADVRRDSQRQRLFGNLPSVKAETNTWIKKPSFYNINVPINERGTQKDRFYNCFIKVNGADDKLTYLNDLFQLNLELERNGRNIVIINNFLPAADNSEIAAVKRRNYRTAEELAADISSNINFVSNTLLCGQIKKSFIETILKEAANDANLTRTTNKAVFMLCWLRRYQGELFKNWKNGNIACFIFFAGKKNQREELFLEFLSYLPVDILILNPSNDSSYEIESERILEINYEEAIYADKFPKETDIRMGTAAYHAERELDNILYNDTGLFRNQQYKTANTITLRTMYEEIPLLWDEELKYRPNFSVVGQTVNIPVIYAKVSGVKDEKTDDYWYGIKSLITEDTFIIRSAPFINPVDPNAMKTYSSLFLKNGRLQKNIIRSHKCYQFGYIRDEMQEYLLDKLQCLIDQKIIKGTFENGTEYLITATILNMNRDIMRLIQRFDFTKKNPKVIYINTTENLSSPEDAIIMSFLNLIGFDILFFMPTGYNNIENHLNKVLIEEYNIGGYMYDLNVPDFKTLRNKKKQTFMGLFKKGK